MTVGESRSDGEGFDPTVSRRFESYLRSHRNKRAYSDRLVFFISRFESYLRSPERKSNQR